MDWDDIRVFLAVARGTGLTGAARLLNSSAQTMGRRIAALEENVGATLFIRGPAGYSLTEDGQALLADAERIEEDVVRFRANAAGRSSALAGTDRIAAAENFVTQLLAPGIGPFLQRHPDLRLEFITGIAPVSMARGDADLAIRLVRPDHGEVTIRQIGTMLNALYASDDYLRSDPEARAHPLKAARLIGWDEAHSHLPAARWLAARANRRPDITFTALITQRAATMAGLGVGFLPQFLAEGLERLPCDEPLREPIWLVGHRCTLAAERVRAVYDEVARIMIEAQGRLGG